MASKIALAARQFPQIRGGEPPKLRERVTFDHLMMQGCHATGAPFARVVAGARSDEAPFRLEPLGETGRLRLDGGAPRGLQADRVGPIRDGRRQTVDEGRFAVLSDAAIDVASVYAALRDDSQNGSAAVTDFEHAVRPTRLIEDALAATGAGSHLTDDAWPTN